MGIVAQDRHPHVTRYELITHDVLMDT